MIEASELYNMFHEFSIQYFTGVPDSTLKHFCDYIMSIEGTGANHIVAANEGNAVALASGYYLATGKPGLVYMQNSGIGNAVNPIVSLTDEEVYGIPVIYLVGWRGKPGMKDEPQHCKQGKITEILLKDIGIECSVIGKDTELSDVRDVFQEKFLPLLKEGKSVAFIVEMGSLISSKNMKYENSYTMSREEVIEDIILSQGEDDITISTTGKASRELFELREKHGDNHNKDFLTVGSMGHASMISLAIAEIKKERRVWCIDGDGAILMHMGSMATIGNRGPENFCHVLLNNQSHETVGGLPTVSSSVEWTEIAKDCGYSKAYKIVTKEELKNVLENIKQVEGPVFLEVMVKLGSRKDLGRPTTTAKENKDNFMNYL